MTVVTAPLWQRFLPRRACDFSTCQCSVPRTDTTHTLMRFWPSNTAVSHSVPHCMCACCRKVALACEGLSGRTLRKLPFLAFSAGTTSAGCSCQRFLRALLHAAERESADRAQLLAS